MAVSQGPPGVPLWHRCDVSRTGRRNWRRTVAGMHPTDVRPARQPAPVRTRPRRRRGILALLAGLCGLARAGLTYLGLTELTTPSFPPAMTAPAPATVSPTAGTTTGGPARLGAVSWPADGFS